MFKTQIEGTVFDTELLVEGDLGNTVSLKEVGGSVLAKISCENSELPKLGRYEFYVNTSDSNSYLANQMVTNGLAKLVRDKKHVRKSVIYLVYRLLR